MTVRHPTVSFSPSQWSCATIDKYTALFSQLCSAIVANHSVQVKWFGLAFRIIFWEVSLSKRIMVSRTREQWRTDQPERRLYTGLLGGSSNTHQRWGVIYNHFSDYSRLHPCTDCLSIVEGSMDCLCSNEITHGKECCFCCDNAKEYQQPDVT